MDWDSTLASKRMNGRRTYCFSELRARKNWSQKYKQYHKRPQIYSIRLEEYAAPSFCSFYKAYVGIQDEITALLKNSGEIYRESFEAVQSYFTGTGDGQATLCHSKQKIIFEAELVRHKQVIYKEPQIVHMNVWDCPYRIRAEKATVDLFYIRSHEGKYIRSVRSAFEWPEVYNKFDEKWASMTEMDPWGFPGMICSDAQTGVICGRLAYVEKTFKSKERMLRDIKLPSQVDFRGFFDDFFGDG